MERAGEVLLMRRAGTGFFDGLYSLPGGHVEPGESLFQTARREASEELGVIVDPADLTWVGVVHRRSDSNRIDFFVRAGRWRGEPGIAEPAKCDALGWFPRDRLPAALVPYIGVALAQTAEPWVLELGW
jgi:8-oxo-dGTP pyrophosphatase MutT (NUDIX family)